MQFKSVCLALSFGELTPAPVEESTAAESYAIAFCAHERAHLSVFMAAPNLRIPSAGFVPLTHALVDEINAERRIHAEAAEKRITSAATIAGITVAFQIVQQSYTDTNHCLAVAARPNDIVIVSRPMDGISLDRDLIEAMLFTSGRPVLVIPPHWERGAKFQNIMIGWDGGARAARAVGDALPFLTRAEKVEILCVAPDRREKHRRGRSRRSPRAALQDRDGHESFGAARRYSQNSLYSCDDGGSGSVGDRRLWTFHACCSWYWAASPAACFPRRSCRFFCPTDQINREIRSNFAS